MHLSSGRRAVKPLPGFVAQPREVLVFGVNVRIEQAALQEREHRVVQRSVVGLHLLHHRLQQQLKHQLR